MWSQFIPRIFNNFDKSSAMSMLLTLHSSIDISSNSLEWIKFRMLAIVWHEFILNHYTDNGFGRSLYLSLSRSLSLCVWLKMRNNEWRQPSNRKREKTNRQFNSMKIFYVVFPSASHRPSADNGVCFVPVPLLLLLLVALAFSQSFIHPSHSFHRL